MKKVLILLLMSSNAALAQQHPFIARIMNHETHQPAIGATAVIPALNVGSISNGMGIVIIPEVPAGNRELHFSSIGYETKKISFQFPQSTGDTLAVYLEPSGETLQDVVISTTRNNSYVKDLPVRVEVIGPDDIDEKIGSTPANVSELLGEASGIQVLPTATSTGNVSVRIQGLEGRYTQLLKDGFPMYGGFSGGLSILQIPPLDSRRVEIIKGSSSALYGGDAIAGLVNFISKTPTSKPYLDLLLNQSQRGATDVGSYFSERRNKFGVTLLATYDRQSPNDINGDGFADIPQSETITFNPRFFYYFNDSTILSLSLNTTADNRAGGDIYAIKNPPDSAHSYTEHNVSQRNYYQLKFEKRFRHGNMLVLKNSLSGYKRKIILPGYAFGGTDINSYSEASYLLNWGRHKTVAGINLLTDHFRQNKSLGAAPGSYNFITVGAFLQDDWEISGKLTAEAGFRGDEQNSYGFFPLPRVALLYKIREGLSARIGGGFGYQVPTIFNVLPDQSDFSNVRSVSKQVAAITSRGANLGLNYVTDLSDELTLAYDQTFFVTRINKPIIPESDSLLKGVYYFKNANAPEVAKGIESNFKFDMDDWEFVVDYTYTNARNRFDQDHPYVPLDPINKILLTLIYEKENDFRAGIEGYYSGRQYLRDGTKARDYWTVDVVGEKMFKYFSIMGNIENIQDTRQSRFGPLVFPPYNHPTFAEIFAPIAGITAHIEVRIRL
jgi:iron complex outermembrane receptor protein